MTDSKSVGSNTVWVQVPPSAPRRSKVRFAPTSFYAYGKKDVIRPLPCSSFPTATRWRWARSWFSIYNIRYLFFQRFPAASCRSQVAHFTFVECVTFLPAFVADIYFFNMAHRDFHFENRGYAVRPPAPLHKKPRLLRLPLDYQRYVFAAYISLQIFLVWRCLLSVFSADKNSPVCRVLEFLPFRRFSPYLFGIILANDREALSWPRPMPCVFWNTVV